MSEQLLIKNARIINPASNDDFMGSMLIEDGIIVEIAQSEIAAPEGAKNT